MATVVRRNERSWAIDLISDLNTIFRTNTLHIKRAGGESTISTGRNNRMFPDVILYGDELQTNILQGWELKLPDTSITDDTFIKDAQRKALSLGLNSCFIWNFTSGVLYVQDENGIFNIKKQWNDTNYIRTREDVTIYRAEWLTAIRNIIFEINQFLINGQIKSSALGEIISDSVVTTIINRNKLIVAGRLFENSRTNALMKATLELWWSEVRMEYTADEPNLFSAYAKILLLNWTNRIVFAHLIKGMHNDACLIESINFETSPEQANNIFNEITSQCDFYNIFTSIEFNTIIPIETWDELVELNMFLTNNGIDQIEQTSLQTILEKSVSTAKRELSGQFTTPTKLAELLVRITVMDWSKNIIDTCCGTGSIPNEIMKYKKTMFNAQNSIETTWASDKFTFPLQITNISLTSADSINIPNRIFQHNVLNLRTGENISITNPNDGDIINLQIPLFGSVVSNLPFIPFEILSNDDINLINNIVMEVSNKTGVMLDGRSDLYSYIVFAIWSLLESNGTIGVITSNSWLGTDAGKNYFKALVKYFKVKQVHISSSGRWFNNAKVVTTITILSKRERVSVPDDDEVVTFCKWNKSLSELNDSDEICAVLVNSSILNRELDANVIAMKSYTYLQIKNLQSMNVSLNALFYNIDWLLEIKNKLIPLNKVFSVLRGERRGWDAMFYPGDGHNIEDEYINKVLKNARHVTSLFAEASEDAFCCSEGIDELERKNSQGALSWIKRFENSANEKGQPLPLVLKKRDMHWYEMSDKATADIFTTMNPGSRLFFAKFEEPTFINQRLIGLKKKSEYADIELNHALLNSMIGMFYIEAAGFGRGLGALDISKKSINSAFMLNPNLVSRDKRNNILEKFSVVANREIKKTEFELESEDRIEFEHAVLQAFDIDNYFDSIKQSLLSMQSSRLSVKED